MYSGQFPMVFKVNDSLSKRRKQINLGWIESTFMLPLQKHWRIEDFPGGVPTYHFAKICKNKRQKKTENILVWSGKGRVTNRPPPQNHPRPVRKGNVFRSIFIQLIIPENGYHRRDNHGYVVSVDINIRFCCLLPSHRHVHSIRFSFTLTV